MIRHLVLIVLSVFSFMAFAAMDLNKASLTDLQSLPGVGEKIAKEIVAGRPYKTIEELKKVKGIGEVRYPQIAPLVMVEAAAPVAKGPTPAIAKPPLIAGERVNINKASLEELQRLPGIGPAKAQEIVRARPFRAPEDILRVKGIAPATYEKLKNSLSVE